MSLLPEYRKPFVGWICYDADCPRCRCLAESFCAPLTRRGFKVIPLQTHWLQERFGLATPYSEMAFVTHRGAYHGGVDALLKISGAYWWARPIVFLGRLPGIHSMLSSIYRRIAKHRSCRSGNCRLTMAKPSSRLSGWLPLVVLPTIVLFCQRWLEPWAFMWLLAIALFASCKWLTWWAHASHAQTVWRSVGYLTLWPGMDAR